MSANIIFYVGLPVALSILNGVHGSLYAPDLGAGTLVPLWYACSQFFWLVSAAGTFALVKILKTDGTATILLAACGGWVGMAGSYFYMGLLLGLTDGWGGTLSSLLHLNGYVLADPFLSFAFGPNALGGVTAWVAAFAVRNRVLNGEWGRASLVKNAVAVSALEVPGFLRKANPSIGHDVIALEAQEHYLKVYTALGDDLVMYRMRDAVSDLKNWPGIRVHRSYWVATSAIKAVEKTGRTLKLRLSNDLEVPVSQSYRGVVEHAGLL